ERTGLPPVGYVHLRQFVDAALDPAPGFSSLTDASRLLRQAGVTDLIVDFRYNGGGLLSVADTLLDLLGGETAEGAASFKLQVNDKHPDYNNDRGNWAIFNQLVDSFSPLRIAFITSGSTASASELVINGLNPHIDVVMIGENTFGKQVGQFRWDMHESVNGLARADCDIALRLTAFELVNGENQGGYHQIGLEGTGRFTLCQAEDDIFNAFGDPRETLLATALDWFGSGVCPQQGQSGRSVPLAKQSDGAATWLSTQYIPERIDENLR
ncbi:MAG: S41 family peptidase, partial [Proteobacteria bacterium]|nr:S41 family peptidase [Pseudomonadota bacterium]